MLSSLMQWFRDWRQTGPDRFSPLPPEKRLQIVDYLNPVQLRAYGQTSKQAAEDADAMFEVMCRETFRSKITGKPLLVVDDAMAHMARDPAKHTFADLYLFLNQNTRMAAAMAMHSIIASNIGFGRVDTDGPSRPDIMPGQRVPRRASLWVTSPLGHEPEITPVLAASIGLATTKQGVSIKLGGGPIYVHAASIADGTFANVHMHFVVRIDDDIRCPAVPVFAPGSDPRQAQTRTVRVMMRHTDDDSDMIQLRVSIRTHQTMNPGDDVPVFTLVCIEAVDVDAFFKHFPLLGPPNFSYDYSNVGLPSAQSALIKRLCDSELRPWSYTNAAGFTAGTFEPIRTASGAPILFD